MAPRLETALELKSLSPEPTAARRFAGLPQFLDGTAILDVDLFPEGDGTHQRFVLQLEDGTLCEWEHDHLSGCVTGQPHTGHSLFSGDLTPGEFPGDGDAPANDD